MGTYYYAVCEEEKTLFYIGRNVTISEDMNEYHTFKKVYNEAVNLDDDWENKQVKGLTIRDINNFSKCRDLAINISAPFMALYVIEYLFCYKVNRVISEYDPEFERLKNEFKIIG